MPRTIRVLDQVTVNKIAAGEVVESPSSVVKELVENSIDAGSTNITVEIDRGGLERIIVKDNGRGMEREDVEIAFTRHSTSKISSIDDLEDLHTLGFRGEALASISAVANVELITAPRRSCENGTRIQVSAGKVLSIEGVGCPEGTQITVTDLFENVPARKKFLRSVQSEKARSIDIFQRMMLVNPHIDFRLIVDGQERSLGRSTQDLRQRAAEIFGIKAARSMMDLGSSRVGALTLYGLVSLPWETRSNSGGMVISVNGRVVRNKNIVEAIRRGYGSRLMKGRFPLAVILIEMDKGQVDANVHPTKDIVKFRSESQVGSTIESLVSKVLFQKGKKRKPDGKGYGPTPEPLQKDDDGVFLSSGKMRTSVEKRSINVPLMEDEVRPQQVSSGPWNQVPSIEGMENLPPSIPDTESRKRIRIIGQLDRSYILCEIGPDLLLVDQHAAHERIRLEMIKKKHWDRGSVTQELLEPINIDLDPSSMENLTLIEKDLKDMGFDFERFGTDMITIRGLPQFLGRMEGHEVLRDMISGNEHHEGCSYPDDSFRIELPIKERMVALTACRGAIKAHQRLSLKEMEDVLEDLLECEVPLHCAHGRPTMVRLPLRVLEKWFKRVV